MRYIRLCIIFKEVLHNAPERTQSSASNANTNANRNAALRPGTSLCEIRGKSGAEI